MGAIGFRPGQRVFLDSNALIYWVEDFHPYGGLLAPIFKAADRGEITISVSALSLLETQVAPIKKGDEETAGRFREIITASRGVDCHPITVEVLEKAARLRADANISTPDAIVAATCMLSGADTFVTNDSRLKGVAGLNTVLLSEVAAS